MSRLDRFECVKNLSFYCRTDAFVIVVVVFSRVLRDSTPRYVSRSVGRPVPFLLFQRFWAFWAYGSCPDALACIKLSISPPPVGGGIKSKGLEMGKKIKSLEKKKIFLKI